MEIVDKNLFVNNLLEKTHNSDDVQLSEYFSNLNWNTEKLFSNIYDVVFLDKLCDINKSTLNGLLSLFLTKEEDDIVNSWITKQIIEEVPATEQVIASLQKLNIANNNKENTQINFEENYLDIQSFGVIQKSQKTLFDLFTTESWTQELAKKNMQTSLLWKLSDKELEVLNPILEKLNILEYDVSNKNIVVNVSNLFERFILGSFRNYLYPLKLSNNPDKTICEIMNKLNEYITNNYISKDWDPLLEVIDINDNIVYIKWSHQMINNIDDQNSIIKHMKNEILWDLEQEYFSKEISFKSIDWAYLEFLNSYFIRFLRESKIDSSYHDISTVQDFSFQKKSLFLEVPDETAYSIFDTQLSNSDLAKKKMKIFFPDFQFFYRLWWTKKEQKSESKDKNIIKNKSKITNSYVSIPLNQTKTLDTFYSLDKNKVQSIIDLLKSGKNIAINGSHGLWKTHLVQAIANTLSSTENVLYTTWDKFCNEYWTLWRNSSGKSKDVFYKGMASFLDSFEWTDILIIDWIDALGWTGKANTQDVLKKIVLKNPDMKLIFTSRTAFKDIPWMKKKITMDKTTYTEPSTLFDEIFYLNLIVLPELKSESLSQIVQDQWKTFLNKKSNLFLPKELPEWVVNLLSKKVNPSLYEQIFTSLDLNLSQDCSVSHISTIVQNFVSEKIQPEPDEIISVVIDSILDEWNGLSEIIWLKNMQIDVSLWDKQEILKRLQWPIKTDSLESIVVRLAIFFVKQHYPKKTFTDIWMYFNGRNNCGVFYKETLDWIMVCKGIDSIIEKNIQTYLFKMYWIND